jgi:hypothetical protein
MHFALPPAPPEALRAALTTAAGLRAWWDPGATFAAEGVAAPGIDAFAMAVADDGDAVVWRGELLTARFDLAARALTVTCAAPLDPVDREELEVAWTVALATLAWALDARGAGAHDADVAWRRLELPLALAYTDAWGRIDGAEGLAGGPPGPDAVLRFGPDRVVGRRRLVAAPRAVIVEVGGTLLRVVFGPGASVNAARVDRLAASARPEGDLPAGWEAWLARRLGMTWVVQLGEEGG